MASRGAFDVDVDPVVVPGCFGELLDLLLGDFGARGPTEVFADEGLQLLEAIDHARH
jgi:hypothetical protein